MIQEDCTGSRPIGLQTNGMFFIYNCYQTEDICPNMIVCTNPENALISITTNWRASVASETLTGVTQSKIGDVCLFIYWRASVASETVLGVDNAKSGICYIYI